MENNIIKVLNLFKEDIITIEEAEKMLICEGVKKQSFESEMSNFNIDKKIIDDDVLRVLVYKGKTLLNEYQDNINNINFNYDGNIQSVECYCNFSCHNVNGDIKCDGNISCDSVEGDVNAGGNVSCDNVVGDVNAGNSISCDNIKGDASAGTNISCDKIYGDVKCCGSIN